MKKNKLQIFFFIMRLLLFFNCGNVFGETNTIIPIYNEGYYKAQIEFIYRNILADKNLPLEQRLKKVSQFFLGKKYLLGALGEGYEGEFDKSPLYRTDAFDCETYVSTLLALIEAKDYSEFVSTLKKIRYKNADVSFQNRYHFTDLDWNFSHHKRGKLKDITANVSSDYQIAIAWIDKPAWFNQLSCHNIKSFKSLSQKNCQLLTTRLHNFSKQVSGSFSHTPYIPLTVLFSRKNGKIVTQEAILNRIPSGAVIEIVNKTGDIKKKIGTDLNVAHLGLALRTSEGLVLRHASSIRRKVMDQPFARYFLGYYLSSPHPEKIGVHIEQIIY